VLCGTLDFDLMNDHSGITGHNLLTKFALLYLYN